jgi:hypothetical protein
LSSFLELRPDILQCIAHRARTPLWDKKQDIMNLLKK